MTSYKNNDKSAIAIANMTPEDLAELDKLQNPDSINVFESKFTYTEEFQQHILNTLIRHQGILDKSPFLKSGYFTDETHQTIFTVVKQYHLKYADLPDVYYIKEFLDKSINHLSEDRQKRYFDQLKEVWDLKVKDETQQQAMLDCVVDFYKMQASKAAITKYLESIHNGKEVTEAQEALRTELAEIASVGVANDCEFFDLDQYFDYADSIVREYLVDDWLLAGSLTLFAGKQKLGKSTLMFSLIAALLTGEKWLGEIPVTKSPVFYLDFENPADYVMENLTEYLTEGDQIDPKSFFTPKDVPSFLSESWLCEASEKLKLADMKGVMIVDSGRAAFNNQFSDVDSWENKAGTVRLALEPLQRFARETGWSVIVVHHDNKQGGFSGSSDWEAVPDYIWRLEETKEGNKLSIRGRLKYIPNPRIIRLVDNRIEFAGTVGQVKQEDRDLTQLSREESILSLLPKVTRAEITHEIGKTRSQLAEQAGLSDSMCYRVLRSLMAVDPESGRRVSEKSVEDPSKGAGRRQNVYFREPFLAV